MKSDEALAAEQAMESKLSEAGLDQVRRVGVMSEAAPDLGTPAEVVQADGQPRNDQGQFASLEESEVEAPAVTEEPQAETQESQDPAVAALLQKYGGDVNKALEGAVHLQRKAGQQSNEVGELRRMVDELSEIKTSIAQGQQQQPVMDQATVDWFDQQTLENPYGMAEYARQQNNGILMQRALSTWKDIDPYQAAVYTNNLQNEEQARQFEEKISKLQQLPMDASINVALTNVQSRHPELVAYSDAIEATMEKYPSAARAVQYAAESNNAGELEAAIETLYGLAQGDTLRQLALTGPAPDSTTTSQEVAAPTISESHESQPELTGEQRFREAFRQEAEQQRRGVFVAE